VLPAFVMARSTKARANSKQSSPAEKIILLGRATARTGLRKSELLLFLKEMNILNLVEKNTGAIKRPMPDGDS
jgi:hypothetical protein